MALVNRPNSYTASTTISSSEVNDDFDTIYNEFNGGISAANLATDAVSTAKIADSAVTTAKLAASAVTTAKITDANVSSEKLKSTVAFRAYESSGQSIPNATYTTITYDTEVFDYGTDFVHTTGIFTAPVTGLYYLEAGVGFSNAGASKQIIIQIQNTTTSEVVCEVRHEQVSSGHDPRQTTSTLALLTAGDTVIARTYQDSGGSLSTNSSSAQQNVHFSGYLVGQP